MVGFDGGASSASPFQCVRRLSAATSTSPAPIESGAVQRELSYCLAAAIDRRFALPGVFHHPLSVRRGVRCRSAGSDLFLSQIRLPFSLPAGPDFWLGSRNAPKTTRPSFNYRNVRGQRSHRPNRIAIAGCVCFARQT